MALPKLNNGPKYDMTIPSTGKAVRFRPFVMREQKALMIAAEANNMKSALKNILDILLTCIDEDVKPRELTSFDVEYMFLQMRAKSVGETAQLGIKCKKCNHVNEININVEEISIDVPDINKKIQITDDIIVEVDYPSYLDLVNTNISDEMTVEDVFKLFKACIRYVATNDERINVREEPESELDAFIDSLSKEQFAQLKDFVDAIPRASHEVKFTCKNCSDHNELNIEGISSFLG